MKNKDTIGWLIFVVGFTVCCIFGLNIPTIDKIDINNLNFFVLMLAVGAFILGAYDQHSSTFELEKAESLKKSGNMKFYAGIVIASVSIFNIYRNVPPHTWHWFFVGGVICLLGIGMLSWPVDHKKEAKKSGNNHIKPLEWIKNLIDEVEVINYEVMQKDEIKKSLEKIELERLVPFVDRRHHFSKEFGPARFAEFFSVYSSGEMYFNRAWSSLVDGYLEESKNSINHALEYFKQTREILLSYEK